MSGCPKGDSRLSFWFSATQLTRVCLASYCGHLSCSACTLGSAMTQCLVMSMGKLNNNKKHLKNVGPICHCEPPPHCHSPGVATVLSHAACASMSTTTTTTTRDGTTKAPWNGPNKSTSSTNCQYSTNLLPSTMQDSTKDCNT